MTTWTKKAKASGTTWTKVTKSFLTGSGGGKPIGLLLALTYPGAGGTTWTKVTKPSGTVWTKVTKAT